MIKGKKMVDTEGQVQNQLKKEYEHSCKSNTEVKIEFSVKIENINTSDIAEVQSYFAECSHNFYLLMANKLNNML